jgi:hypothetical protein
MADLISPGISVSVTDLSFYIPATATTVPLIFVATKEDKLLADGTKAVGTTESNVIRTVTSLQQSKTLYGIPTFLTDSQGLQHHGDARNEYGVHALNQFLREGNFAYVIRANIDLDDDRINVLTSWNEQSIIARNALNTLALSFITDYNNRNGYVSANPLFKQTINSTEFSALAHSALSVIYRKYVFRTVGTDIEGDLAATPLNIYANGYNFAATGSFIGLGGSIDAFVTAAVGSVVTTEFTPAEAVSVLTLVLDAYQYTLEFATKTTIGVDDAHRRIAISTALREVIVGIPDPLTSIVGGRNENIRSEEFEYNLVVCPGYPEVVADLASLVGDINDEAFVIADTPNNLNPDLVVNPWSGAGLNFNTETSGRVRSWQVAYYYPPLAVSTNLNGVRVAGAISGVALAAYTNNDNKGYVWGAPGGVNRALLSEISGVTSVGYVSGSLGSATTYVDVHLNQGQRDNLYKSPTYINPVINSVGTGIALYGQRVSCPGNLASARDRVGVSRGISYIRRSIRKFLIPYLFEPNDAVTRANVKSVVDSFLHDIMAKRGLDDFATICDESNNTGDKIDRNELWIDIALKPKHAIEFIYVPINVLHSGDVIGQ